MSNVIMQPHDTMCSLSKMKWREYVNNMVFVVGFVKVLFLPGVGPMNTGAHPGVSVSINDLPSFPLPQYQ